MIGARLTEALAKTHGFAGAWSGFRVLRGLVEEAWERVHPAIEDGDLEVRAAPFAWLDDPARGARFPSVLCAIPLARGAGEKPSFSCLDWEKAKTGGVPMELLDQGVQLTPRPECQATFDALDGAVAELGLLTGALDARMNGAAPGMLEVRKALEQCHQLRGRSSNGRVRRPPPRKRRTPSRPTARRSLTAARRRRRPRRARGRCATSCTPRWPRRPPGCSTWSRTAPFRS